MEGERGPLPTGSGHSPSSDRPFYAANLDLYRHPHHQTFAAPHGFTLPGSGMMMGGMGMAPSSVGLGNPLSHPSPTKSAVPPDASAFYSWPFYPPYAAASSSSINSSAVLEKNSSAVLEKNSEAVLEKNSAVGDRNSGVLEKNTAFAERNSAVLEKNTAVAERNSAVLEKNTSVADRNSAVLEKNTAVLEKNSVVLEKDRSAVLERNSAFLEKNRSAVLERNSAVLEKNSAEKINAVSPTAASEQEEDQPSSEDEDSDRDEDRAEEVQTETEDDEGSATEEDVGEGEGGPPQEPLHEEGEEGGDPTTVVKQEWDLGQVREEGNTVELKSVVRY
jgi:hypothetical protein